jgi:hypothetical protein
MLAQKPEIYVLSGYYYSVVENAHTFFFVRYKIKLVQKSKQATIILPRILLVNAKIYLVYYCLSIIFYTTVI